MILPVPCLGWLSYSVLGGGGTSPVVRQKGWRAEAEGSVWHQLEGTVLENDSFRCLMIRAAAPG